jgi:hypothetical protein
MIVLSLFFHFLLAFHGQFVLLFLNEEFSGERRASSGIANLLRSKLFRDMAKTGPEGQSKAGQAKLIHLLGA